MTKTTATIATVKAAVRRLGGEVVRGGIGGLDGPGGEKYTSYLIDAPDGYIWLCSSIHTLQVFWKVADNADRSDAIADALERIASGIGPCDDPDCDLCVHNL